MTERKRAKSEKTVDMLTEEEKKLYAYEIEHNEPLPCVVGQKNAYFLQIKPNLEFIRDALERGVPVQDICDSIRLNPSQFYRYLHIYSQFADIYNACRQVQIKAVEGALFRSAQGHTKKVQKPIRTKDGFVYAEEEVYVPPNPQAQQFLLKNLMSKVYKDKVEVEQTVKIDVQSINGQSTEALLDMLNLSKGDKGEVIDVDFVEIDEAEQR